MSDRLTALLSLAMIVGSLFLLLLPGKPASPSSPPEETLRRELSAPPTTPNPTTLETLFAPAAVVVDPREAEVQGTPLPGGASSPFSEPPQSHLGEPGTGRSAASAAAGTARKEATPELSESILLGRIRLKGGRETIYVESK
jgi:hypothetical protein